MYVKRFLIALGIIALGLLGDQGGRPEMVCRLGVCTPAPTPVSVPFTALHTYFMSPTGSDANNGTSTSTPWLTPNHAVVCGDVIIAQAGAYTSSGWSNFGTVSNCPSTTGGIDGAGGIYFVTLLCGGGDLEACTMNSGANTAMDISSNNWAIEGWKITAHTGFGIVADGCSTIVHHIVAINVVLYDSLAATFTQDCGTAHNIPGNGADYYSVVGSIVQNGAQRSDFCVAAIDDVGPAFSDTVAGTHVFIHGNFVINSAQTSGCGINSDGESIMFDTWEAHGYSGQGIVSNNIMFLSERNGFHFFFQNSQSSAYTAATVKIYNNTAYDVSNQFNSCANSSFSLGNFDLDGGGNAWPFPTTTFNNIGLTQSATNCAGTELYALQTWYTGSNSVIGGTGTENIFKGHMVTCSGTCDPGNNARSGNAINNLGTNIYTDPLFTNQSDAITNRSGTPNCTGFINTTACMGYNVATRALTTPSVISDFVPTCSQCSGKGYQLPSTTCLASYPDYPTYLKGIVYLRASGFVNGATITENNDLVTKLCGM